MLYDLFICHASEDKQSFVRPLASALRAKNVEVWYDEFSLKLGDSIRRSIDKGLRQSRFGAVVLSKSFFEKKWPQYELDGLVERKMQGRTRVILPIWHGVSHNDVVAYSPALAGRKAVSSAGGLQDVVSALLDFLQPEGSPLIIARDTLLQWGVTPPVVTDPYWLDVVEASNRSPAYGGAIPPESIWGRWSFPLPGKDGGAKEWGERLAWTAMQTEWTKAADAIPISPLTEPRLVLDFINSHLGLFKTCKKFPELLTEYAPQLTIPGMGGDFEPDFEKLYALSLRSHQKKRREHSIEGSALTTNRECPLCDEEWALRHPTFGDYDPVHVANAYFMGGMFGPSVSPYEPADHVFWLLSTASSWLPPETRAFLTQGMAEWHVWPWGYVGLNHGGEWKSNGALAKALYNAIDHKNFKWSDELRDDCIRRIKLSIRRLKLKDKPIHLFEEFLRFQFPERFITAQRQARNRRKRNFGGHKNRKERPTTGSSVP